jgi:putative nucleotidyltransferase with HDIG domain
MTTALMVRYIAYALYLVSLIYGIVILMPLIMNKTPKSVSRSGSSSSGGLADLMGNINQWTDASDDYEDSLGHSRRVADLARQIGEKYGLPSEELDALECAALLHDIGQINNFNFIKEQRLLTVDEKNRLQEHTILGENLLKQIADVGSASLWVRWHHERWDGFGYPDQLSGEMIPLPVRILTVADVYDSLTHNRPYRSAMTPEEAMNELQKMSGIMFDPNVIQVFMSIDSEAEIGSSLEV